MKQTILSLLTLALVSSCGLYKQYERPEKLPTTFLLGGKTAEEIQDSVSLASVGWQAFFADDNVRFFIDAALKHNYDLRIAQERIVQAEANLRAARLSTLPSLALSPSLGYTTVGGKDGTINYQAPQLLASWQADIFASLRNAKRRSRAMLEATEAYEQAVRSQLIASVARTYYTLVLLDEQLRVSTLTEQLWGENVRTMRALFDAGVGNDAAVSRSEAAYASVRSSVLSIRQQIKETERAMNHLMGRHLGLVNRGGFADWRSPEVLKIGTPLYLLSRRPDLKMAEANLRAAFYGVGEAKAAFYPQITLSATAGWVAQGGKVITQPAHFVANALASLVQPLFQRGKLKAGYRVAESKQREAHLAFKQAILKAGDEVMNHLEAIYTHREQAKLQNERSRALERSVKATKMLMQSAASSYLEVLTAQQALLEAQLAELSNRYNEIASTIALYQALGGGAE